MVTGKGVVVRRSGGAEEQCKGIGMKTKESRRIGI
jgi:hypothetical protein